MENSEKLARKAYDLAKENNRMLHAMRRNAFLGGILKLIIWAFMLGMPIWLYIQFVHPVMQTAVGAMNELQGSVQQVQGQMQGIQQVGSQIGEPLGDIGNVINTIESFIPFDFSGGQ